MNIVNYLEFYCILKGNQMQIIENNDKLKQNQNSFEITNVSYFEIRGAFGCGDYFRID